MPYDTSHTRDAVSITKSMGEHQENGLRHSALPKIYSGLRQLLNTELVLDRFPMGFVEFYNIINFQPGADHEYRR
jgi:hypothetical protein